MTAGAVPPEPSTPATWLVTTVHNRTQHPPTMPALTGSPALQVWDRGSSVRVSLGSASWAVGPKPPPPPLCLAPPQDGGECHVESVDSPDDVGRQAITVMSKGSRRRLMEKLATIDREAPAVFVTLTWPSWAAPDREAWHRSWDRWRKRLARAWPDAAGLWRREYTKSGTVHLHLLMFGVAIDPAVIRQLQTWTAKAWADSVDAAEYDRRLKSGTSVEVPRIGAAVSRYVAKYASKAAAGDGTERPMGRWWGTFGEREGQPGRIPYTLPLDIALTEAEGHLIRRTMERWLKAKRRTREAKLGTRIKGRPPRPRHARRIFTEQPDLWLRLLDVIRSDAPPSPSEAPLSAYRARTEATPR